jgi:hypothetical protein
LPCPDGVADPAVPTVNGELDILPLPPPDPPEAAFTLVASNVFPPEPPPVEVNPLNEEFDPFDSAFCCLTIL